MPSTAQALSKSAPYGRLLHAQPRNLNDENFHLRYLHRLQRRHLLRPRAPGRDNDVYTRCVRKEIVEIDARCSAPLKITNKAPALTMKLTLDHSLVRLFLSVQRLSKTVMRSAIRSGASTSRLRRCIGKHQAHDIIKLAYFSIKEYLISKKPKGGGGEQRRLPILAYERVGTGHSCPRGIPYPSVEHVRQPFIIPQHFLPPSQATLSPPIHVPSTPHSHIPSFLPFPPLPSSLRCRRRRKIRPLIRH